MSRRACVIGAGPNGLAAAIVLAQAGLQVDVFEAEPQPGGAARTLELTIPGFMHDFGSAVHPLAAGSPFFSSLPLPKYGLQWIHSPAALAHPLDDGTAVLLDSDLSMTVAALGSDGKTWRRLMEPLAKHWPLLSADVLRPVSIFPRHPWLLARFGLSALPPANALGNFLFRSARTKALFAGLAAHSFLSLDEPLSAAFGVLLGAAAHAVGWPIPHAGAQSITKSLCGHLSELGGSIKTSARVEQLRDLPQYDVTLCDITPRQLLRIADDRLSARYKRCLLYTSSAFAAEIGTMKVTEEIDALQTMAISPIQFLVTPKFLAMIVMLPCLTIWANSMGILGGALFGVAQADFTWGRYIRTSVDSLFMRDIVTGLIKSAVSYTHLDVYKRQGRCRTSKSFKVGRTSIGKSEGKWELKLGAC